MAENISSILYWSLLKDGHCETNGVSAAIEGLHDLGQNISGLKMSCDYGINLTWIDLSPRFSLRNFMRYDYRLGRLFFYGWGADIRDSNMENAIFEKANLTKVIAFNTNLNGANFTNSILNEALFSGSTFISSKLFGVRARNTYFNDTDMTAADLSYSDLTGSNFKNANLTNAIFKGAILSGVAFEGANLIGA